MIKSELKCKWESNVFFFGMVCVREQEESGSAEGGTGQTEGCAGLQGGYGEETSW